MDNLLNIYLIVTNIIAFVSFVAFIVLISSKISTKNPLKVSGWIILIVTLVGMYLFVPSRMFIIGTLNQNVDYLEKAIKLSINPIEKRLCWENLAYIYEFKNGNKAIECFEKALNGEYLKYAKDTEYLAYLYSLKGDYKKTLELNNILNVKNSISLRNAYIQKGEYEKALGAFEENSKYVGSKYLQADLYKKLGELKKADLLLLEAQNAYNLKVKEYTDDIAKLQYQKSMDKYKTIESYKNWLNKQREILKLN